MAEDSEQEKYYRRQREKEEREEAEKRKEQLEKWDKEKQEEENKKQEETSKKSYKQRFKWHLFSSFSSAWKDITNGDFKKIFLLPIKLISDIFKLPFIGSIIYVIFIILIIVLAWGFLYNLLTGGGTSVFGTQLSVLIAKTPIKAITTPIQDFWSDPVGTIAQFGTFKPPETVEKRKPQGVEIRNFETKRPIHRAGIDNIETVSNVKIYALEDSPTQVSFSCEKSDPVSLEKNMPATEVKISGELEGSSSVYVFEKQDKNVNIQCKFDKVDLSTALNKEKTIQEKITLISNYQDFIVNSRIKIYTLEKTELELIENQGLNPFTYYRINDPLVSVNDRSVRPEQLRSGPVKLSFTLLDAQPLTEGPIYLLGIELFKDTLWNGKISKLKYLKLFMPEGFSQEEGSCQDFDQKENNILELSNLALVELSKREIDKERFFCDFKIDSSAITEALDYSLIEAEAKFDYAFESYTTATISQGLIKSSISSKT